MEREPEPEPEPQFVPLPRGQAEPEPEPQFVPLPRGQAEPEPEPEPERARRDRFVPPLDIRIRDPLAPSGRL